MSNKENDLMGLFDNIETGAGNDLFGTEGQDDLFSTSNASDPFTDVVTDSEKKNKKTVGPVKEDDKTVEKVSPKKEKDTKKATPKKATEKKKEPAKKKTATKKKPKVDDIVVNEEWTVAYAARQTNPPREMKISELREHLELDYPELSKERCEMKVEEERKLIVPIVKGSKNG